MRIFYNRIGTERKLLAASIKQELNVSINYLGAPTFAYEIGDYRIDKNGLLEGPDNPKLVEDLRGLYGFTAINEEFDTLMTEIPACSVPDGEEPNSLTIEMPLDGFTDAAIANLEKLIASKAGLIKKALGIDGLPIERTDSTLRFPWFTFRLPGEEVAAYARFIGALYAAAKKQQRVTAKEHAVDNEKFAFRVFLIRLGFVGDDYKAARKILLRNLSGDSAYAKKAVIADGEVEDNE